ncbi:MAG: DNA gyrase inhibitor YacG [Hyphomicrobiales bacterium]|nr:DNA gyrase inhibitor YacG [Hyphomicrobiales bacterium]
MRKEGAISKPCPICGKPSGKPFTPFCSRRCADIDLGRWLKGVYAIPVSEAHDVDGGAAMSDEPLEKG